VGCKLGKLAVYGCFMRKQQQGRAVCILSDAKKSGLMAGGGLPAWVLDLKLGALVCGNFNGLSVPTVGWHCYCNAHSPVARFF
jgi:hypothetical protein